MKHGHPNPFRVEFDVFDRYSRVHVHVVFDVWVNISAWRIPRAALQGLVVSWRWRVPEGTRRAPGPRQQVDTQVRLSYLQRRR